MTENNDFDVMQQLDQLSELKEMVDERYRPIIDAKINYRLQQIYKDKQVNVQLQRKHCIPERSGR